MKRDPRAVLDHVHRSVAEFSRLQRTRMAAWEEVVSFGFDNGALDTKTKELLASGISLVQRCDYCIAHHVYMALKAGATRDELMEAAYTAIVLAGGPAVAYAGTFYLDCVKTFAPDFGK
jgi:AhpD family alkylhydroperoxidase